jgi:hypothetical protein
LFGRRGWTTLGVAPDIRLALDTEHRVTPCSRGSPALMNIVDMADRIHGSESTRIVTEAGPSHRSGSDEPRVLDTCCEGTSAAALQVSQPGTRLAPAAVLAQITGTILPMTQIDWQWLTSVGTGHEGALVVCPLSLDLGRFSSI